MIAIWQRITFKEYLPYVLGRRQTDYPGTILRDGGGIRSKSLTRACQHRDPHRHLRMLSVRGAGYNASVDPSPDLFFSTVAMRYGHSSVNPITFRINALWNPAERMPYVLMRDQFQDGRALASDTDLEMILRGLVVQREAAIDTSISDDLRNHFFSADVMATNIVRARSRGLPTYNAGTCIGRGGGGMGGWGERGLDPSFIRGDRASGDWVR